MSKLQLQSNFIEIALLHGCSPVDFLHISYTFFQERLWGGAASNVCVLKVT